MHTIISRKWSFILVIALLMIILGGSIQQAASQESDNNNFVFLTMISGPPPDIRITDAWVGNDSGFKRSVFRPSDPIEFITVGENGTGSALDATLKWFQTGPSGSTEIYSGTVRLASDIWVHAHEAVAPDILGTYTNTVELTYDNYKFTRTTTFDIVNYTSEVVVNDQQGFDKCGLPTVEDMQTWWDHSPYEVFNIYLGGSSFACDNPQLNDEWVWQVSQHGWEFILTWVGPQSPCFNTIRPKISYDTDVAYQQGIEQADLAIAVADSLGITGDRIIYYDIEGYTVEPGEYACRNAVDSFLTGWTARLHELGFKAGAYGSPCRSFISDWWDNQHLLDDIWIARWITPYEYRENVSVFGSVCGLTDDMWANNQRLRQYAGDHVESWGDVSLGSIDSNVLLGEITAITTTTQISTTSSNLAGATLPTPMLREAQMVTNDMGWALQGHQLLITQDSGASWRSRTPEAVDTIFRVSFVDEQNGWLISPDLDGGLLLHQTADSGLSWQTSSLPFSSPDVGAVYLDRINAQTGWIVLKLTSGSSFSVGRLFATQDGGQTWEERSIPLGEPVQFSDAQHGWVAGGPNENEYFQTTDGGRNWSQISEQEYQLTTPALPLSTSNDLPENTIQLTAANLESGWALTQTGDCAGEKNPTAENPERLWCWQQTQLWSTNDGGQTWVDITP
jgi:photosystem II stability/assembly factor-like uncharacterized protein